MPILSIQQLSKNYGSLRALHSISFDVPPKTVFGILGPNGSGKTTLLGIVMDILKATEGTYQWMGEGSSSAIRKKIGTLLETPNFYHYLSAVENLRIAARIKGADESAIPGILETVNLLQRKDSKFSTFSLGMKQRLAIASTLLGDPDILVFDEPTNGLDPAGIAEIRELIKELNRKGKTIIMASHILDEVEKVCTHVAIIQKGVLKTVGSVHDVMNMASATGGAVANLLVEVSAADKGRLLSVLEKMPGLESVTESNGDLEVICPDTIDAAAINAFCFENGVVLNKLLVKRKSLETRFLEITGTKSEK